MSVEEEKRSGERTNEERAEAAYRTLLTFAQRCGGDPNDVEANVIDLMADLLHLCDQYGMDQSETQRIALSHYAAEKPGEEDVLRAASVLAGKSATVGNAGWGIQDRATGEWVADGHDSEIEAWIAYLLTLLDSPPGSVPGRRYLYARFDVTGLSYEEIGRLELEVVVQAESSDADEYQSGHPDVPVETWLAAPPPGAGDQGGSPRAGASRAGASEAPGSSSGPVFVTAVAFQHKTPGEGVGGFEWDLDADEARRRISETGVYGDPNYETFERTFTFDTFDKEAITAYIDAEIWVDTHPVPEESARYVVGYHSSEIHHPHVSLVTGDGKRDDLFDVALYHVEDGEQDAAYIESEAALQRVIAQANVGARFSARAEAERPFLELVDSAWWTLMQGDLMLASENNRDDETAALVLAMAAAARETISATAGAIEQLDGHDEVIQSVSEEELARRCATALALLFYGGE